MDKRHSGQMIDMTRRSFFGICGGLVATSALPTVVDDSQAGVFATRGNFERLAINYVHIPLGLKSPFSVLHISDTHLTAAYPTESEKKRKISAIRTRTFGGRQEEALRDSLAWAKENVDYVIHTGDVIDFQSQANFDLVKKYFRGNVTGALGNHEFSPEMWLSERKETKDEAFKDHSRALLESVYPFDISFQATVVNGVNFVTLDDVYEDVTSVQVDRFKAEVAKGLPIVLCMHVPIASRTINMISNKYWMGGKYGLKGMKFRSVLQKDPAHGNPVTRGFVDYLKSEPLLKAILCGHNHYTYQEEFSPTARQYIVGSNFMFHGQEVLFT